jgi:AcrR family transcriptional regulator
LDGIKETMPKIVDHDAHRLEIVSKAAKLFSKHGYSGLGMRKIAAELGLSKSALYHYFPNKLALFHACTDYVTSFDTLKDDHNRSIGNQSIDDRLHALFGVAKDLEPGFADEMAMLFDYLRNRTPQDIAADPSMKLANERYEKLVTRFVGDQDAKPVLCLLMGALLMRYFDGGSTDLDEIEKWLIEALKNENS